jgi:hypothetical protein
MGRRVFLEAILQMEIVDGDGGEEWLRYVEGFGLVLRRNGAEIAGLSPSFSSHLSG